MSFDKTLSNNIIIKLLKTLDPEEWKDFEKFAGSPYFNEGRNYIPLLKILKKYHPDFDSKDFTKDKIYKKLFPGKEYKESVLNSMLSRLYSIGEKYLVNAAVNKNENMIKERMIIKELRSRGVMLKLNKQIDENLKHLTQKKFGDKDFKKLLEIYHEINKLNQVSNKSEIFYDSITKLIKYIYYNFFYELNLYLSAIYSLKHYWKEDFDKSYINRIFQSIDFKQIFKILEKEDYKSFLPVKLCYLSYLATRYPEKDDYYYEMKSLFKKESECFDFSFKEIILTNLGAICSMKMILGNSEFKYEAFEIRKLMLEENMYNINDEYMKIGDFRSIFLEAMNVGQIEWGKNFLENNFNRIHPDFRTEIKNYCNSWLAYERGDYDKAIEYAGKVNVNQITFKLDLKNILSRAYFDTNSTESLLSLLNSYSKLISNSGSKNKFYLDRHKNFIKYLRKLIFIKEKNNNKTELAVLKDNIENENVSSKSWLIKKLIN